MSIPRQRRQPPLVGRNASRTLLLATDLQQSVFSNLQVDGLNRSAFTPYGFQSSSQGARSHLGFNGQLREPTGWYHLGNGHRVYNPVLMRFHSPDQLSPFGAGGMNPYAYCSGSPVGRVDPSGKSSVGVLTVGTGGILNLIFLFAAFNRAAMAAVNGTRQSLITRAGNSLSFWGALFGGPARFAGYAAAAAQGPPGNPTAWISNVGSIVSQILTGAGAVMQNAVMTRNWMRKAHENGQSIVSVAKVALLDASGFYLLMGREPEVVPGRTNDVRLNVIASSASLDPPDVRAVDIRQGSVP